MRILAVSDIVDKALYDNFDSDRWAQAGVQVILGCGDLPAEYLSYLVSVFPVPLYYVRGNHDVTYGESPPLGCENIDRKLVTVGGLRILGIEGSAWYNGGPAQYSEMAMAWRLLLLRPTIARAGGVDVVVAHGPPAFCAEAYTPRCPKPICVGRVCNCTPASEPERICQDASDHSHRGLAASRDFILRNRPAYFLHGHRHQTYGLGKRELAIGKTRVVDVYGHRLLDVQT